MNLNWLPLLDDLRHYRREWLAPDLVAGFSVAAVQVPTAVAYAQLVGFSPEVGLYASMLPVLVYALFSSIIYLDYFYATDVPSLDADHTCAS